MYPVRFISLGPGDPELITLKGWKALQEADVVFCPETLTAHGAASSRAADILLSLGITAGQIRRFRLPMSKRREEALAAYDRVYAEAILLRQSGKRVCITAEGDAGLYASIHYVHEQLQANGIPVEQVPGIPAFIACGARGGLHLASGGQRLVVLPGIATTGEIEQLVASQSTVVVMKLSQCSEEVRHCLRLHPDYDYHYFENIGMEHELYLTDAAAIAGTKFPYFSILVVRRSGG